ncbi:MAG TPA: hypothetical protein VG320_28885 [Paraburkholderia sp.]|jgi:hypothetical protein|uniref:hypothetical protein n=1 Tax=Paraburkholderia sp. TaxID=1926495 RepID=UPI002DF3E713|nr:hypothetical protein [Paraburkholderia sp.]
MQRRLFEPSSAAVISVVLATISLAACGPGVGSSAPETASAPVQQQDSAALQPAPPAAPGAATANTTLASGIGTAAPADTANPASYAYASDPVQSVQASLAADSQQVAPVMSYAPGDEPSQSSNDSRSTATTRQ